MFAAFAVVYSAVAAPGIDLDTLQSSTHASAVGYVHYHQGKIVEQTIRGTVAVDSKAAVSDDAKWHLGSNAKAMTATLAARLVEEGKISWTSTVGDLLKKTGDFEQVTLAQLIRHQGGAPASMQEAIPKEWKQAFVSKVPAHQERRKLVQAVLKRPTKTVGSFVYSNAGYLIAAAMLEEAAGKPYEALLQSHVFAPLSIKGCAMGAPEMPDPLGTTSDGPRWVSVEPARAIADNPLAMAPAGTIKCDMDSWLKFAKVHLAKPDVFLSDASFEVLHSAEPGGYAGGWIVNRQGGAEVLMHSGSNTFSASTILLVPAENRAYLVAINSGMPNWTQAFVIERLLERNRPKPGVVPSVEK